MHAAARGFAQSCRRAGLAQRERERFQWLIQSIVNRAEKDGRPGAPGIEPNPACYSGKFVSGVFPRLQFPRDLNWRGQIARANQIDRPSDLILIDVSVRKLKLDHIGVSSQCDLQEAENDCEQPLHLNSWFTI